MQAITIWIRGVETHRQYIKRLPQCYELRPMPENTQNFEYFSAMKVCTIVYILR
jgi:hypothetical protein